MKAIILIFAFCIFTATFANASRSTTFSKLNKIYRSSFGRTIIDTVQMELKSSSKADPRPRIQELLKEILDETRDAITNLDNNIALTRDNCQSVQGQLSNAISNLEAQVDADTNEQRQLDQRLSTLNQQVESKTSLLQNYNDQLAAATEARAANQGVYEQKNRKYRKVLDVLDQILELVNNRIENRNAPAFLQKSSALLEIKRNVESHEFLQVAGGWGKFVSFITSKAFTRIRQTPDDAAVEGLNEVVNVIRNVVSAVNQEVTANNVANEADKAAYESQRLNLETVIATSNADLASTNTEIANVNNRLADLANSIETNGDLIVSKNEELSQSRNACRAAEDVYATTIASRNDEMSAIQEVMQILQEDLSNLSQFTESTIQNSSIEVGA